MAAMEYWPPFLQIGRAEHLFAYTKISVERRCVYICSQGSEDCRQGEVLVLMFEQDHWMAFDGRVLSSGEVHVRQPVFRTKFPVIYPGWHEWEINANAGPDQQISTSPSWECCGSFETRGYAEIPRHWQVR